MTDDKLRAALLYHDWQKGACEHNGSEIECETFARDLRQLDALAASATDEGPHSEDAWTDAEAIRRDAVLDAAARLAASAPDEGPDIETQCYRCGGDGWFIDADPLPSGEPGEPYQVQCGDCGGTGVIYQPAARPAVPALDVDAERLAHAYNNTIVATGFGDPIPMSTWRLIAREYSALRSKEPTDG